MSSCLHAYHGSSQCCCVSTAPLPITTWTSRLKSFDSSFTNQVPPVRAIEKRSPMRFSVLLLSLNVACISVRCWILVSGRPNYGRKRDVVRPDRKANPFQYLFLNISVNYWALSYFNRAPLSRPQVWAFYGPIQQLTGLGALLISPCLSSWALSALYSPATHLRWH